MPQRNGVNDEKDVVKVTVLMPPGEFERLDGYCKEQGLSKSGFALRLIRQFLDMQGVPRRDNPPDRLPPKGK